MLPDVRSALRTWAHGRARLSTTKGRVAELIEQDRTVREIAHELGISTQAVYKHLRALNIAPPSRRRRDDTIRGAA